MCVCIFIKCVLCACDRHLIIDIVPTLGVKKIRTPSALYLPYHIHFSSQFSYIKKHNLRHNLIFFFFASVFIASYGPLTQPRAVCSEMQDYEIGHRHIFI